MTEIERLIDMLGCGNATPQERIRWAHSIVDLARAEGVELAAKEKVARWAAIHKEFPNLPTWTEVERLREAIFAGHTSTANVDALCAAVAAEERERIKRTCLDGIGVWDGYVMVPDSVLAPEVKP